MNIHQLFHTISYLKPIQVIYQLKNLVEKPKYIQMSAPIHEKPVLMTEPIARYKGIEGDVFTFINLCYKFEDWNYVGNGTLFTYNLNYFDFINVSKFAEYVGINESKMRAYKSGVSYPGEKTTSKIFKAVKEIGKELCVASFL